MGNGGRERLMGWAKDAPVLRRRAGALVVDSFFRGMASLGRLHPKSRPERHGLRVERDIPYRPTGMREHLLDVWRPAEATGPLPVVLYVHGGGFRILSKDTHWIMGLAFARRGYVVFNVNYRLAPRHPFPAAIEDVCAAYAWVVEHAARFGGDSSRLVLAGESAGANLCTSLAVATSYRRPEPWAAEAWNAGVTPGAVIAACGMMQVSDPDRFRRRKPRLGAVVFDRIQEVSEAYLGAKLTPHVGCALADPLLVIERGTPPDRPLPPFFLPVGTRDPLLDDTRRLCAALGKLGVPCQARYYPGEMHAFHAVVLLPGARRCWSDIYEFLDTYVPPGPTAT